jgi:hypothetical protein
MKYNDYWKEKSVAKPKSENETILPNEYVGQFEVAPFTFGQLGKALKLFTPYLSAIDLSTGDFGLGNINLNVMMYTATDDDCAGIFELAAMSTGESVEAIKALSTADGIALIESVWKVAISPAMEEFKKKLTAKTPGTAKEGSQT